LRRVRRPAAQARLAEGDRRVVNSASRGPATIPSPTGASLFVGALDAASSRSGFPAWSKTQRHAYCSVALCAHQTLLPPTWKLCCLPASQLPVIGRTRDSEVSPDLLRKSTRSTPFLCD